MTPPLSPRSRRPTSPGEFLREDFLLPRGIDTQSFADAIGLSRKQVSLILNGRARLTPTVAARVAKVLGTSVEFWVNAQALVDAHDAAGEARSWVPPRTFPRAAAE